MKSERNTKQHMLATMLVALFLPGLTSGQEQESELVAYFPEWSAAQHGYTVKSIVDSGSAELITVLNYSFIIPGPDQNGDVVCQLHDENLAYKDVFNPDMTLVGPDGYESIAGLRGHFGELRKFKSLYPHVRVLAALGGWTGSTWFSDAAMTEQTRATFVSSCIDLLLDGNLPGVVHDGWAGFFDGFDIDWEYPITGGDSGVHHNNNDDVNLTALLAEFRKQMGTYDYSAGHPGGLLLTMATPGSDFRGQNYQINQDKQHVDWFNLMTYDFHGTWENKTGHHSNLRQSPDDPSSDAFKQAIDNTVRLYRDTYGVGVEQLVIGGAFYGRGWKGVSSTNNGLYQGGRAAPGLYEDGYNLWRDLEPLLDHGYEMHWDSHALASWLYSPSDSIFWTLDDPQSLALKKRYADAYGLRGTMTWEISGDNENGDLLKALHSGNPGEQLSGEEAEFSVISIDQPADCSIALEGSNIVMSATAGDYVRQVTFYLNDTELGFDNRMPWSWAGFNLPGGVHTLTAAASNENGDWQLSAPITLTVYGSDSGIGLWATGMNYISGDRVYYEGCLYSAKRNHVGSRVRTPTSGRYWNLLTCSDCDGSGGDGGGGDGGGGDDGGCPGAFDLGATYNKGDEVMHSNIRWRAKRTVSGIEPGTSPSKWTNLGECTG